MFHPNQIPMNVLTEAQPFIRECHEELLGSAQNILARKALFAEYFDSIFLPIRKYPVADFNWNTMIATLLYVADLE